MKNKNFFKRMLAAAVSLTLASGLTANVAADYTVGKGSSGEYTVDTETAHYGDIDNDGSIDMGDTAVLFNIIAGWVTFEGDEEYLDLNLDGVVNISDVSVLQQYLSDDKITTIPCSGTDSDWDNPTLKITNSGESTYNVQPGDSIKIPFKFTTSGSTGDSGTCISGVINCDGLEVSQLSGARMGKSNKFYIYENFEDVYVYIKIPKNCSAGSYSLNWEDVYFGNAYGQNTESPVSYSDSVVINVLEPETTEAPTEATTKATTKVTTQATTEATTKATTQVTTEAAKETLLYCDVNGDGSVDDEDFLDLMHEALDNYSYDKYFDLNLDGVVNVSDVSFLQQYLYGNITALSGLTYDDVWNNPYQISYYDSQWEDPTPIISSYDYTVEPGDTIDIPIEFNIIGSTGNSGNCISGVLNYDPDLSITAVKGGYMSGIVDDYLYLLLGNENYGEDSEPITITLTIKIPDNCQAGCNYNISLYEVYFGNAYGQHAQSLYNPVDIDITVAEPVTTEAPTEAPTEATTTTIITETNTVNPDINGDGKIDTADIVAVEKFLTTGGSDDITPDVNNDGKVNVFDLIIIKRYLLSN